MFGTARYYYSQQEWSSTSQVKSFQTRPLGVIMCCGNGFPNQRLTKVVYKETMFALLVQTTAMLLPLPRAIAPMRAPAPTLIFDFFKQTMKAASTSDLERVLLEKPGLSNFKALEKAAPSPQDLLYTDKGTASINGRWLLLSTIAAGVGEDVSDEATAVPGAVNASGLVIDTSGRLPVQEVDLAAGRIGNEIRFNALGRTGIVRVAGGVRPSTDNGRRAMVEFDTLDVFLLNGDGAEARASRLLRAGWLFRLVRLLRPSLQNGADEASWLDTTYISPRVRLGRGNKGSVFILEKLKVDGPLANFPL